MYPLQIFKKIILGPNVCLCVCFLCKSNISEENNIILKQEVNFFRCGFIIYNNNNKIGDKTEIEIEKKMFGISHFFIIRNIILSFMIKRRL